MATRRPLVLNDGLVSELLDGDTVTAGTSTTQVIAGSGLTGGGSVPNNIQVDLALAPNPSGIIYVGDALGIDGAAQVTANTALASGSTAAFLASNALASGNNSLVVGTSALASGNAALSLASTLGGGGTQVRLTAASAVVSGYAVGVDDTGRLQSVVGTSTQTFSFPSAAVVFESAITNFTSAAYDSSNNRVVVGYSDQGNSNFGTAVVGTVSGTSISFGTPVVFRSASVFNVIGSTYDSTNNRVVFAYQDGGNSNRGTAIVGTVSGTSISFGTAVVFQSSITYQISATYDSISNRVVIAYANAGNSEFGTAVVGTVSGTSISFGTPVVFQSNASYFNSATFDSTNNKIVIAYTEATLTYFGYAIIGTVSGTSISFGTPVVFRSGYASSLSATYNSINNRVVISYEQSGAFTSVGTVSGTSISFGTAVSFGSSGSDFIVSSYDSTNNRIVVSFRDANNSFFGTSRIGTVSGTSISFGSPVIFRSASTPYITSVYNSINDRTVVSYNDGGNSGFGTSIVGILSTSTSYRPTLNSFPNVLGISQSTVASGSPCLVNLPGTLYNEPAANLSVGAFYYADPTTSGITTTPARPTSWNGQVPWNFIGRAVTSSGLMLLRSI